MTKHDPVNLTSSELFELRQVRRLIRAAESRLHGLLAHEAAIIRRAESRTQWDNPPVIQ